VEEERRRLIEEEQQNVRCKTCFFLEGHATPMKKEDGMISEHLVGGFKDFWNFHPENWGR